MRIAVVHTYGASWVAMVPASDGSGTREFSESRGWLLRSQLPDDWGHRLVDVVADGVISTLG